MTADHARAVAPRVALVKALVGRHYRLTAEQLNGSSRKPAIAHPRQLAIYLAVEHCAQPIGDIAERFGRDRATIRHACGAARRRIAADPALAAIVEQLVVEIRARSAAARCTCRDCAAGDARYPLDPPQMPLPIAFPGELPLQAGA